MKFVLAVLIMVGLLFVSACPELQNSAAKTDADSPPVTLKIDKTPEKQTGKLNPEIPF